MLSQTTTFTRSPAIRSSLPPRSPALVPPLSAPRGYRAIGVGATDRRGLRRDRPRESVQAAGERHGDPPFFRRALGFVGGRTGRQAEGGGAGDERGDQGVEGVVV